jgi:pimeloyl-ACP methyl ester carboxylesterase
MAERAGAEITVAEDASHVPMMSQPQRVADVILTAVAAAAQKNAEA